MVRAEPPTTSGGLPSAPGLIFKPLVGLMCGPDVCAGRGRAGAARSATPYLSKLARACMDAAHAPPMLIRPDLLSWLMMPRLLLLALLLLALLLLALLLLLLALLLLLLARR